MPLPALFATLPFNALSIIAAIIIALASALPVLVWRRNRTDQIGISWHMALLTLANGLLLSGLAVRLVSVWTADMFGTIHIMYTILTIGVPLAAAMPAIRWRGTPRILLAGLAVMMLGAPVGLYASFVEPF